MMTSFLSAVAIAALSVVTIITVRQYRSKMIIDQYLKEQAGGGHSNDERGAMNHWDPTYFPEENELDLDVEPALQYRDHINPEPAQQPPAEQSFLPQIS